MFFWTSRNSCTPPDKVFENIMKSSEPTISRRHNTQLSSGLNKQVHSLLAAERKRCIRPVKVTEKEFFFGARRPLFLGMHRFCFLLEASWETVTFVFKFFFIMSLSFFYFFLIPTYSLQKSNTPPKRLSKILLKFQFWSSRKSGAPQCYYYSQVHSYLLRFHLWAKLICLKIVNIT